MRLGLVALLLGLGIGPVRAEERFIVLVMADSRFHSAVLRVEPGTEIRFQVVNEDPIDHEWIVGDAALHARHRDGTEPVHDERPTEVTVPAGSRQTTVVTFPAGAQWTFICHLPGHEQYGMVGTVVVER